MNGLNPPNHRSEDGRAPKGFSKVETDPETGTVVWPGGAYLAPDMLDQRLQSARV